MKSLNLFIFFLLLAASAQAQEISGTIHNQESETLAGASIFAKGTYDGTSSDSLGSFSFRLSNPKDSITIVARYLGHETYKQRHALPDSGLRLIITLIDTNAMLNTVMITAGAFEASDKKKGVVLRPVDIVTTAGSMGDIAGAINTLPGTQVVGEEGQIFVRGGTAGETRTFIDGMRAPFFYTSQVPDLPARGRFSPFLFKGTLFTSGGYSAEYGQALSSALILETEDLPEKTLSSISLMTVGLGAAHTQRWKRNSLTLSADYTNLAPYFTLIPQRFDFGKFPQGFNGAVGFRQQMGKSNMAKGYVAFSRNDASITYPELGENEGETIRLRNDNLFAQGTGSWLAGKWLIKGGLTYGTNEDNFNLEEGDLLRKGREMQAKVSGWRSFNKRLSLRTGATGVRLERSEDFLPAGSDESLGGSLTEHLGAAFAEADWKVGKKWAFRSGLRAEYSDLLDIPNLAPRLSMAYQTGDHSQVSGAYGLFYQNPPHERLWSTTDVHYEQAQHLMLNYQWSKKFRTLRVEAYYKWYDRLLRYDPSDPYNPAGINSEGDGYARGLDIFWRDSKTIRNSDYWVSYSYLDTERKYRDYPVMATPHFASKHNFSLVGKHFISAITTQVGFTYRYASPRPYHDPNKPGFLQEKTPDYHNLSLNLSYLTEWFGHYTIVHAAISNVTGAQQIFGYRYANDPDTNGQFARRPIRPSAPRFFFVGIFISID